MRAGSIPNSAGAKPEGRRPPSRTLLVVARSGGVSGNGASPPICSDDPRPLIPPGNYEACCGVTIYATSDGTSVHR
jgi:hypothetical protein